MAIINTHPPLAFASGILGNIISVMFFLAPLPTFYRIHKRKSTEGFQSLPYLVALFSAMLWLYYAFLKGDAVLLITINSFGCIIETMYIGMFVAYAPRASKGSSLKFVALVNIGLFCLIVLISRLVVKDSCRVQVVGWICVAVSVIVFAAPLSIVFRVIRTRSVEFMPFYLSVFLTLSAITWFAYGIFVKDIRIAVPNILGFVLGLVQMVVYGVYRNSKKVIVEEEKLPEQTNSSVMLGPLGACEDSPVDAQPDDSGGDAEAHERSMEKAVHEIQPV